MTFLNPFLLFGLAAAAIPILIHLLNKRKLRTIEFSTLSFLKELQKNKMRKLTLRQWLLLLLRTLIIICLVLAFSRPALQGNFGAIGTHAKTTLVIILDNTASMDLQNERGKFLAQAKGRAMEIVSLLQENDDVFFLRLSDLPDATTNESTHDIDKLQSLIQGTSISNNQRTIDEALVLASQLLSRSKNYNKEIYVITDGQKTTFVGSKKKMENHFDPQVKLFVERMSDQSVENVGIEKVTILPSLMQLNKQITLNAVVKNYGSKPVKNHIVGIILNNNRTMQKSVSLNSGESATIDFAVVPTRTGFLSGVVDSEDDLYEPDNKWFFSFYIPEKIQVALVSEKEEYRRYLSTALSVAGGINASSSITVTTYSPSQISNSTLASTDILILSGVYNLSQEQQRNITGYLSTGGSLMFFPGSDTVKSSYEYLNALGLSPTLLISSPQSAIRFENVDLAYPIFTGMFEPSMTKSEIIETPDITKTLAFQNVNSVRPIITLTNGQLFLWQHSYQSGTILGFSVPATTTWSNFPLKGIFVPLVYQSVLYLASQVNLTSYTMNYTAGEKIEFSSSQIIKKSQSENPLTVVDSKQRTALVHTTVKKRGDGSNEKIFSISDLPLTGEHYILQGNDTVQCFPINISRLESYTNLVTEEEISALADSLGIKKESLKFLTPQTSLRETIAQSRFGIELWRYFALLAVIIALCEMVVAREKKE